MKPERNFITGLVLIFAIAIGYSIYTSPGKEEAEKFRRQQDSLALVQKKQAERKNTAPVVEKKDSSIQDSVQVQQALGGFSAASVGKEEISVLENNLIRAEISSKGGKILRVQLKKFKTWDGKPLFISDKTTEFGLNFFSENKSINTNSLFFTPSSVFEASKGNNPARISMKLGAGEGKFIEYVYSLKPDAYDVDFDVHFTGMQDVIASNSSTIDLIWKNTIPRQEKNIEAERGASTIYYRFSDDEVDYLNENKDGHEVLKTRIKWVSFKQQYFTSVFVAKNNFDKPTTIDTKSDKESITEVKKVSAQFTLPYNHTANESFSAFFYFGPNHYNTLKAYNLELEKQIPLGWGIFGWVNRFIVINIFHFLDQFHMNYGLVILILTLVIKVILLPFTYKAYQSQAKMKVLKPEIDEIQSKKKEDPMKMQQEMMGLYRKAGVNPLGGCLPMLFQLPILIAMFRFFPASIELRQQSFLWAKDLSTYDSILDLGFRIPGYGDHISLFTLLMTISTLMYTRMNNQFTGANSQMKVMSYLMPIIFLGVFNNYSAGLSYYYFLANMVTFGQQYMFRKFVNEEEIHRKIQENKKKPGGGKSKFQQRLEEMAKQKGYKPKK